MVDIISNLLNFSANAQAAPGPNIGSNLMLFPGGLDFDNFFSNEAAALALLLLALLALLLLSVAMTSKKDAEGNPHRGVPLFKKPQANNLFLKVNLTLTNGERTQAYLRSLGVKEASLVL